MINFQEEISKYKPLLEIDDMEDAIRLVENNDLFEVLNLLLTQNNLKLKENAVYFEEVAKEEAKEETKEEAKEVAKEETEDAISVEVFDDVDIDTN